MHMRTKTRINFQQISIETNPYIEAMGVLFHLADYQRNETRHNERYKTDIQAFFAKFKTHSAVLHTKRLMQENMYVRYNAPVEIMLYSFFHKSLPKLFYNEHSITKKEVKLWVRFVKLFIKQSHFMQFYYAHEPYYVHNMQTYAQTMQPFSPQNFLFSFLGTRSKNLHIICMHGLTTSNYGIRVGKQLYCCIRPYKETRFANEVDFACNLPYSTSLVLHEFAHSFINPLTHSYKKQLQNVSPLCFASIFEKQAYGNHIETAINESIIRSIECLYIETFFTNKEAQVFLENYIQEGFTNIPKLIHIFKEEYMLNRKTYPTIKDFYPKLLKTLCCSTK